jgi:hypothetical protein
VTAPLAFKDAREWGELVAREFSGDAPAEIVPPGIILASDLPEWAVLRGVVPFQISNSQGAVAGQFAFVQITTGPPKDRLAVITHLYVSASFKIGLLATPLSTSSSLRATSRDLRRASLVTFAGINTQAGDPFATQAGIFVGANGFNPVGLPAYVVGNPGAGQVPDALVISAAAVNVGLTVYAWGYERRVRPESQALD